MIFLHLNVHTSCSLNYGLVKIGDLVKNAAEHGIPAAITDYSTLAGAVELYTKCKKAGVKPIYGMEINLVKDKTYKTRDSLSAILIARNHTGFMNLVKLVTVGSMYFHYKPRLDFSDLVKYGEGITVLTGGLNGIGAIAYFEGREDGLAKLLTRYSEAVGENVYFCLTPFPSNAQKVYNEALLNFVNTTGKGKLVVTTDCQYLTPTDQDLHKACISLKINNLEEWKYPFEGIHHLATLEEVRAAFVSLHGESILMNPVFQAALFRSHEIGLSVEEFDINDGIKIPKHTC